AAGLDLRQRIPPPHLPVIGVVMIGGSFRHPSDALLQRFERAVELLHRAVRAALPAGVECVEIGLPAVHQSARLSFAAGPQPAARIPCRGRPASRMTAMTAPPGRFHPPHPKSREKFNTE